MSLGSHLPEAIRRPLRRVRAATIAVVHAGAQPVLTVRLLVGPNLRRPEPHNWKRLLLAAFAAVLLVVAGVVVATVTGARWVVLLVLAPFLVSAARGAWHGRPRRGVELGWPVGRIGRGRGWIASPDWFARQARRYGRVFKTGFNDIPTVCVVDFTAGGALLREHADALGPPWGPYERFVPGGSVRGTTGERHAELRRLFARALGPDLVQRWEPVMTAAARRCMESLAAASAIEPPNPLLTVRACVFDAWTELLLGLTPEPALRDRIDALDYERHFYAEAIPDHEVEAELNRIGALVVANARRDETDTTYETLAQRFDSLPPGALDDPGVMRNLIYAIFTTREDVAGLLMWALWHVAAQPEWRARLRASGVHGEDTDRFVSEVLRLDQSEFVMRRATAPIDHEGPAGRIVVPAEWYVRVCTREIHRDDRGFADPARFDPDRFAVEGGVGNSRAVYAPFGIDHHACLGERLTRTFAQSFVFEAAHWELRTVTDGPTEMSRARHWAPSTRWRLAVTAPAEVP